MPNPTDFTSPSPSYIELPVLSIPGESNAGRELDKPESNCGVVGIFNHPEASVIAYYALHSLQHRGQEAAGILASNWKNGNGKKRTFTVYKDHGLVLGIFSDHKILTETLAGDSAIAHNRYSTTGASGKPENIQPF